MSIPYVDVEYGHLGVVLPTNILNYPESRGPMSNYVTLNRPKAIKLDMSFFTCRAAAPAEVIQASEPMAKALADVMPDKPKGKTRKTQRSLPLDGS